MSIDITFTGPSSILLSHMALLGAASILDDALGPGNALCRWTDTADAVPMLRVERDSPEDVGAIIREHASRHADGADGWMQAKSEAAQSHFAVRAKVPSTDDAWTEYLAQRNHVAAGLRGLESDMTLALGERAWWLQATGDKKRFYEGASPWEMRTRNKGMEVITNGLLPLATAVAARESAQVIDGLTGEYLNDDVGKNSPDSRTSLGLGPLGPTDSARAWCGLWGMSAMPMWHHRAARSTASAFVPGHRDRQARLLMPVPTGWVTVARWRSVLRSSHLTILGEAEKQGRISEPEAVAARERLEDAGFPVVLSFPVSVSENPSSPERRALEAEVL
ncbi:MAG: hypothetical protein Q4G21_06210 [Dermabacter sp.]|nr:hypothetical protein [Dermabacter sp.]